MLSYAANLIKNKCIVKVRHKNNKTSKRANLKTVRKDHVLKKQISSISKQKRVKFKKR